MKKSNVGRPDAPSAFLAKYMERSFDTLKIGTLHEFQRMESNHGDPLDGRIEGIKIAGPRQFTSEQLNRELRGASLTIQARDGIEFDPNRRVR